MPHISFATMPPWPTRVHEDYYTHCPNRSVNTRAIPTPIAQNPIAVHHICPCATNRMWQVIGVVVAETEAVARRGAKLVVVEYEELPAVMSCEEAIAAGAFYRSVCAP